MSKIDIIKKKLKVEVEDSELEFSILETEDYIKNYCNRNDIPKELEFTVAKIVADINNEEFKEIENEGINSISQGNSSVSFKDNKRKSKEDILKSYHLILNRFRKVKR